MLWPRQPVKNGDAIRRARGVSTCSFGAGLGSSLGSKSPNPAACIHPSQRLEEFIRVEPMQVVPLLGNLGPQLEGLQVSRSTVPFGSLHSLEDSLPLQGRFRINRLCDLLSNRRVGALDGFFTYNQLPDHSLVNSTQRRLF